MFWEHLGDSWWKDLIYGIPPCHEVSFLETYRRWGGSKKVWTGWLCMSLEKTSLPLFEVLQQKPCESWPKYGALEEHKNIQTVPRLSLQLCAAEWQVQQKHVEFFTRAYCVPTLTPSWALWARPELCLDSMGLRWLCQRVWPPPHTTPSPSMSFSFALPFPPSK